MDVGVTNRLASQMRTPSVPFCFYLVGRTRAVSWSFPMVRGVFGCWLYVRERVPVPVPGPVLDCLYIKSFRLFVSSPPPSSPLPPPSQPPPFATATAATTAAATTAVNTFTHACHQHTNHHRHSTHQHLPSPTSFPPPPLLSHPLGSRPDHTQRSPGVSAANLRQGDPGGFAAFRHLILGRQACAGRGGVW